MSRFWVVSRKQWRLGLAVLLGILILAAFWRFESMKVDEEEALALPAKTNVLHMVTGEFKSKLDDGQEIEAYVFSPSTVYANDGEMVELRIRGVNGKQHDFFIEGMDVKGSVYKNKETVVTFKAKKGKYKIVCYTHADAAHHGPMIGHIVVD
ncbi:cupredoxin domain-containing protein [Paenibacillus marinisediminis]